jgi:hypothetical protein
MFHNFWHFWNVRPGTFGQPGLMEKALMLVCVMEGLFPFFFILLQTLTTFSRSTTMYLFN